MKKHLPNDWKEFILKDIGISYNGLTNKNASNFKNNCNAKYITYKSIYDCNKIDIKRLEDVYIEENEKQNLVQYGDAFFTISSETPDEVAISSVLLDEVENTYLNSFCFGFRFDFNILVPEFARYYFRSNYIRKYTYKLAQGSTRFNLSKNKFLEMIVKLPTIDEQKRIAEILSTFDDLIENLTKLIEKKELYKKGVMQRVLSGEVRFNGFTDEWEEVYIKDVGTIITGNTPSTKDKSFWGGKHVWVTPTDINKKDIDNSERKLTDIGLSKARKLPKNTLLVTCIASIGKNSILRCEGSCNQQINAIIPNKNFSAEFLYYIFENNKEYLNAKAPASATKIISKTEFEKLSFILPKIEEQNKIAELLTLIDKDIEILKQLLHLRKLQKKGVMQKLLTGEVRV